jgi:hypothetical protein
MGQVSIGPRGVSVQAWAAIRAPDTPAAVHLRRTSVRPRSVTKFPRVTFPAKCQAPENVPHKTSKRQPSGHRITRTGRDRTRIDGKVGSCMGGSRSFNADLPRVLKIETLFCASHFAGPKRARRWLLNLPLVGSEMRCQQRSSGPAVPVTINAQPALAGFCSDPTVNC